MTVKARGNSWVASVGSGDDRFRVAFKTKEDAEQAEAEEIERRRRRKLAAYKPQASVYRLPQQPQVEALPSPSIEVTLGYIFKLAKKLRWAEAGKTQPAMAQIALDFFGERTHLADIRQQQVREYAEYLAEVRSNCGSSINKKLSALSVMLELAVEEGFLESMPLIKRKKESAHRTRFFSVEEEQKMLAICAKLGMQDLADFIAWGIDTGFRRTEILTTRAAACQDGYARLEAWMTKAKRNRSVPLTVRCKEIAERRKDNERLFDDLTKDSLRARWQVMRELMGELDSLDFIPHTLRHTCGTRLALAGKSAPFIKEWLGHTSIIVTQRYITIAGTALNEGTAALESFIKQA